MCSKAWLASDQQSLFYRELTELFQGNKVFGMRYVSCTINLLKKHLAMPKKVQLVG
ncbi:hypothetical protein KR100_07120 [Synechococcus sp. KORDI-100]|nr:hypothetical protein KR100_07120 [Synechococcus sp. KORDI-100]